MQPAVSALKNEFDTIRSGLPPVMVEDIKVEVYGQQTPVKAPFFQLCRLVKYLCGIKDCRRRGKSHEDSLLKLRQIPMARHQD